MSIIVLNAFAESLSVGDIKFPAALLITTLGRPTYRMHPRIRLQLSAGFMSIDVWK